MKVQTVTLNELDGGQFDSLEPASIPQGGWRKLVNFLTHNRRVNVRKGVVPASKSEPIEGTSLTAVCVAPGLYNGVADDHTDEWALVGAGRTAFYLMSRLGRWIREIVNEVGGSLASDQMPWKMEMLSGLVYAVRRNGGVMKSIAADTWREAGRPSPGSAPSVTAVSGGSLQASKAYKISYSYYDNVLGYYGPESASATVSTDVTNKTLRIASFTAPSTGYRANKVLVWCTYGGGERKYKVADLDPSTTSYDITAEPTGEEYSPRHEPPPSDATWWTVWSQRSWWVRGSNLAYSLTGFYESYSPIQELEFDKADGQDITVAFPWGNNLVVSKNTKLWYLEGYDRSSWEVKEWSRVVGCVAPFSMKEGEGTLIWRGKDGFYTAGLGSAPINVTSESIAEYLKGADPDRAELSVAEIIPELGIYVCLVPLLASSTSVVGEMGWGAVAFNWRKRAWSVLEFPVHDPTFAVGAVDPDGVRRTYAVPQSAASVVQLFEGGSDDGSPISAEAVTGYPAGLVQPAEHLGVKALRMLTKATRAPITVSVYRDGSEAAASSVEVNLENDAGWNTVGVSTMRDLSSQVQVGVRYSGIQEGWWLSALAMDLGLTRTGRTEK